MSKDNNGINNLAYIDGGSMEMVNSLPENGVENSKTIKDDGTDKEIGTQDDRPTWSNGLEFLMSCISVSVGLGNIWRFPFTAYENGGGAFLIPYVTVLILIGKPMYYMEMIMGQFVSASSVKVWKLSPIFKGIGIGQLVGTVSVLSYYTSLIALTLHYLFASMAAVLPWDYCKPEWGPTCVDSKPSNVTNTAGNVSSSELYFLKDVLKEYDDISNGIGIPDWKLTLWLLLAWIIVYCIIVRGVKSSGKAAYFLAIFPYVIIITLLIKAVTLEGAKEGILFFLRPQWKELYNPRVWYNAVTQLFFSLSVGMGSIVMFSSYNRFDHNIYRDALIVTTLDTFTSLLGGLTIFAILGNLAHNLNQSDISKVVQSGASLAFISYPDTISKFEVVPQLFSILFFLMLFVLGIGSVVALQNAVTTVIWDQLKGWNYWKVATCTCICGFLMGLIYVTPGGQWMLTLVDFFGGTFIIFVLAIAQLIAVFWVYGLENFCHDLEFMTHQKISAYWRLCWGFITPVIMIIILLYKLVTIEPERYGGRLFPTSAYICGWMLLAVGIAQVFIWGSWIVSRQQEASVWLKVKAASKPSSNWGPADLKLRSEWIKFKEEKRESREKIATAQGHSLFKQKVYILLGKY